MATPISSRTADFWYRNFFILMITLSLLIDITPLYPESIKSLISFMEPLHKYQIEVLRDPLYNPDIKRPWFDSLLVMEAGVLVPLNAWLIYGLTVDHYMVPGVLLCYAYHMLVTTVPCVYETWESPGYTDEELKSLVSMYVPFMLLPAYMIYDCLGRISGGLWEKRVKEERTKKN